MAPPAFVENVGQREEPIRFTLEGRGHEVRMTSAGMTVAPSPGRAAGPGGTITVAFAGASMDARPVGEGLLPFTSNYLRGRDPACWVAGARAFRAVRYRDAYPGIDIVASADGDTLEYDLVLAPEADPGRVRMEVAGADEILVEPDGGLRMCAGGMQTLHQAPIAHQRGADGWDVVAARYVLRSTSRSTVEIELGPYDRSRSLVIDPVVVFSTYLGGSEDDWAQDVAVDATGNVVVCGVTASTDFPTAAPLQPAHGGGTQDAFVAKLDPSGTGLLFATYLGGSGPDIAMAVAVDGAGDVLVAGFTGSSDFPTVLPRQAALLGIYDGFVAKLDATGAALHYATYHGGSSVDVVRGIAVDPAGAAVVVGDTDSADFPLAAPLQGTYRGLGDAFVSKLSPTGSALVFSTYVGGSDDDSSWSVALDGSGSAYVTGQTSSTNFPVVAPFQATRAGGQDAVVFKLQPSGSALAYATYLGGWDDDVGLDVAVDAGGRAVVTGWTASTNFPTQSPFQAAKAASHDAFLARLAPSGSALDYGTYLGGNGSDWAKRVSVEATGAMAVLGNTDSTDFPLAAPIQAAPGGNGDAFHTRFDPSGAVLWHSTYLGGSGYERANGAALDAAGTSFVAGETHSPDFPLQSPFQGTHAGGGDAFVTSLAPTACPPITLQPPSLPSARQNVAYAATITATGGTPPYTMSVASGTLPPGLTLAPAGDLSGTPTTPGSFTFVVRAVDAAGCTGTRAYAVGVEPAMDFAVGQGSGLPNFPRVALFSATGSTTGTSFLAFAATGWGAGVASAHVDGGVEDEILAGLGPGAGLPSRVRGFRSAGTPIPSVDFYAYRTGSYGVVVGGGDVDGDGFDEILTGAGPGAAFGPHVRGFDVDGTSAVPIGKLSFYAYGAISFGARVAAGAIDADGFDEILTGPGPGPTLAAHVRGFDFDAVRVSPIGVVSFLAYPSTHGARPGAGDVDGDGFDEVVTAPGTGPALPARFRGFDYDGTTIRTLAGFDVTPFATRHGGSVAAADTNGDGREDLITGAGPDPAADSRVLTYDYTAGTLMVFPNAFTPFGASTFGVNVAGGGHGI